MLFDVEGMKTGYCEARIKRAVAALGGTALVDLASGTVRADGLDRLSDVADVCVAIEGEGYRVVARQSPPRATPACSAG